MTHRGVSDTSYANIELRARQFAEYCGWGAHPPFVLTFEKFWREAIQCGKLGDVVQIESLLQAQASDHRVGGPDAACSLARLAVLFWPHLRVVNMFPCLFHDLT